MNNPQIVQQILWLLISTLIIQLVALVIGFVVAHVKSSRRLEVTSTALDAKITTVQGMLQNVLLEVGKLENKIEEHDKTLIGIAAMLKAHDEQFIDLQRKDVTDEILKRIFDKIERLERRQNHVG